MGATTEDVFNALGVIGGVVLAFSLLPQIYLAHKRRSTKDISYVWQGIYITGLITLMAYFLYFQLWPVFYPMAFELTCIFYLTGLKVYFEVLIPPASTTDASELEIKGSIDRFGQSAATGRPKLTRSVSLRSAKGSDVFPLPDELAKDVDKLGENVSRGWGAARVGAEQA